MKRRLHFDFEVYNELDIKAVPSDVYMSHPSLKVILAAWAFDSEPFNLWEADKGKAPAEFRAGLRDPDVELVAWNITYERSVLRALGLDIPLERWCDAMVHARYAGLPGRLKDCVKVPMLGVPAEESTRSETLLIKKFCTPNKHGERNLPTDYPEDWARFCRYCLNDGRSERHILHWLEPRFPFPASERDLWMLDQRINERGLPDDVEMARHGMNEAGRLIGLSHEQLKVVTGLENPNSVQQLLSWLKQQGYQHDTLGKDTLAAYVD